MTDTTDELIDGREDVYGDPVEGMQRTALIWSGILGHNVRPDQVPLLLTSYKLMRASVTPTYSDNSDDAVGYLHMFRQVVGDDMIEARSVSEYQSILAHRAESEHVLQQAMQEDARQEARRAAAVRDELRTENLRLRQLLLQHDPQQVQHDPWQAPPFDADPAGRAPYEGP